MQKSIYFEVLAA